MSLKTKHKPLLRGFTYIEVVVAIAVMSIISIGLTQFIMTTAEGYVATGRRNQLSSSGRTVINRVSMEIHNALPNSIRISPALTSSDPEVVGGQAYAGDQCLEYVPVIAATTYIDPSFRRVGSATFDVVEFVPDQTAFTAPAYAVIYPDSANDIYQEPVPTPPARGVREEVSSITHDGVTADVDNITLVAAHRFKRRSRLRRIFLTSQPVSFCITGEKLFRYDNYGFSGTNQLVPENIGGGCAAASCLPATTPDRALISADIDNAVLTDAGGQAFNYLNATRIRNGVVQLEMNFERDGESVLLNHEVLMQGAP